jgi:hypothetical protein
VIEYAHKCPWCGEPWAREITELDLLTSPPFAPEGSYWRARCVGGHEFAVEGSVTIDDRRTFAIRVPEIVPASPARFVERRTEGPCCVCKKEIAGGQAYVPADKRGAVRHLGCRE